LSFGAVAEAVPAALPNPRPALGRPPSRRVAERTNPPKVFDRLDGPYVVH
jgi:hypothetical protein